MATEAQVHELVQRLLSLETALTSEREARQALQTQFAGAPLQPAPSLSLVDTRQLGKPDKFDGRDENWKEWKFVTKSYLCAVNQHSRPLLDRAESPEGFVYNAGLDPGEAAISSQIYYVLVLLTKGRALDKVQAAGEGEGLHAWRLLHLQFEPHVKSRFVGMLMAILAAKFGSGDDILAILQ